MRVTNQLISTTNACALYNKGVSRVVVPVACNANKVREVLKKENKEKMLNYLDIPRYNVSTKGLLIVPFIDFVLLIVFFSYTLIGTMLTSMGKVSFAFLPMQVDMAF